MSVTSRGQRAARSCRSIRGITKGQYPVRSTLLTSGFVFVVGLPVLGRPAHSCPEGFCSRALLWLLRELVLNS
ncbi:hypothetical protein FKM82_015698 [Ascaphus truei]